MRFSKRFLVGVIAGVLFGAVSAGVDARAETWKLELKRLEPPLEIWLSLDARPDSIFRMADAQTVTFHGGEALILGDGVVPDCAVAFAKIVKKEPPKYESKHPVRATVTLGSNEYAFALDMKDSKSKSYDRLYFDLNHNGDLTDDKVIEAVGMSRRIPAGSDGWYTWFPRVDLTIDVGGTHFDYSFVLHASAQGLSSLDPAEAPLVQVWLFPAACRIGDVVLNGRKHRIVLWDHNSNGRFDDRVSIEAKSDWRDTEITPIYGDILEIDPQTRRQSQDFDCAYWQCVSHLAMIDEQWYDLEVSPGGDQISLTPSNVALGFVTNPAKDFRAVMYSNTRLLQFVQAKSEPIPLPEGDWRLWSYTIQPDQEGRRPNTTEKTSAIPRRGLAEQETMSGASLFGALGRAIFGISGPDGDETVALSSRSIVQAWRITESKTVTVRKGQTVALPFGPPYKPIVKTRRGAPKGYAMLSFSLVGSGGEPVSIVLVDGERVLPPEFTVTSVNGDVIDEGRFEPLGRLFPWEHSWRVPSNPADQYHVRVRVKAGPFKIDDSGYSVIRRSDWEQ